MNQPNPPIVTAPPGPDWAPGLAAYGAAELAELDRLAPEVLRRGLPAKLIGNVDGLLACDLDGHPWSRLLAAATCHDALRGDPRAEPLCEMAYDAFAASDDAEGMALAANVRANIALGRGDIPQAVAWWRRAEGLLGDRSDIAISAAAHSSLEAYAKGDLAAAEARAREALLLADAAGQPGDAVVPMVYLTLYAFCQGDLERADRLLDRALVICDGDATRNETGLVLGFLGVIEALRGNQAEADRYFSRALAQAEADDAPWYAAMVRTLRADYTARWAPHRSLVDARRAQAETEALGDAWWHGLACYSEGAALAELGDLTGARDVLDAAIVELSNPVERAFAQLELGEVLLGLGDRPAAREVLEEARLAFDSAGARYWATRSSLAMGAAQRDRGGRWLRLARSTAVDDPAYDRLFAPAQDLEIKVMGRPAVLLDGDRLDFLTRHAELATYLLAIAGPDGVAADELAAALWPGADPRRTGPRLRTLLWQVRNALGREAWRVQRRSGRVLLDLTGVDVDLHRQALADEERQAADHLVGTPVGAGDAVDRGGDAVDVVDPPVTVTATIAEDGNGLTSAGGGPATLRADQLLGYTDPVRVADPRGSGGGRGATTARPSLLEGWDVELPPSLRTAT